MMTMAVWIEGTLYIDPQQQIPSGFCPVCGGELYAPSLLCIKCEGRGRL